MGKSIIVFGANFELNALENEGSVVWHYKGFTENYGIYPAFGPGGLSYGGWSLEPMFDALKGKTINIVRGLPTSAGTYNFYKVNQVPYEVETLPSPSASITISEEQVGEITEFVLSTPIVMGNDEYLVCGEKGLPGGGDFMFLKAPNATYNYLYYKIGTPQVIRSKSRYWWLDFGYDSTLNV